MSQHTRIGIDLGGTKIEGVVVDTAGAVLVRQRVPTPAGDYHATVAAIAALVEALEARAGGDGGASVGIGTPGTTSTVTGGLINSNSVVLNGRPLQQDLEAALGREVRMANDANCFALSEAVDGAGADGRVVFGVILGTGVGGGLVVDRAIWPGRNGIAGEWGHNPLPWSDDAERGDHPCWCGRVGCIETFLSGAGLARLYGTGDLAAPQIVARAAAGDAGAGAALALYQDRLARALAHLVNILDPDVIVLGGGLSNVAALRDGLPALIARHLFSDVLHTPIRAALHGDSSGVRGAAWLWP